MSPYQYNPICKGKNGGSGQQTRRQNPYVNWLERNENDKKESAKEWSSGCKGSLSFTA